MRLTENRTKIQFWHCWKSSVLFLYHLFRCRRCDIFQPANVHWRHRATSSDRNDHTHTHTLVILKRALQTKAKNSCWSNVQYENDNVALFIFFFTRPFKPWTQRDNHTYSQCRKTISPEVHVLGLCKETHASTGRSCKLHTQRPTCCEMTPAPPCCCSSVILIRRTSDLCTDSTQTLFLLPPLHPDFQNSDIDRLKQLETMDSCSTENEWTWMSMNQFT